MTGCRTIAKTPEYSIGIKNGTSLPIYEAHVRFKKFTSIGGYLRPGIRKVYELVPHPIPEKVMVSWKTEDQKAHELTVDITKQVPKNFKNGEILFTILDNETVNPAHRQAIQDVRDVLRQCWEAYLHAGGTI